MTVVMGGGSGVKSFSCKTQTLVRLGNVRLWLGWGFDNIFFVRKELVKKFLAQNKQSQRKWRLKQMLWEKIRWWW